MWMAPEQSVRSRDQDGHMVSGVTLLTLNGSVSLKVHCSLNKTYRFLIWVCTVQANSTKTSTETDNFAIFCRFEKVSITCQLGFYVSCEFVVDWYNGISCHITRTLDECRAMGLDHALLFIIIYNDNNVVFMSLGATLLKLH